MKIIINHHEIWLVVEPPTPSTPLKNDGVKISWDDEIPNRCKNKKCSKPPTRSVRSQTNMTPPGSMSCSMGEYPTTQLVGEST